MSASRLWSMLFGMVLVCGYFYSSFIVYAWIWRDVNREPEPAWPEVVEPKKGYAITVMWMLGLIGGALVWQKVGTAQTGSLEERLGMFASGWVGSVAAPSVYTIIHRWWESRETRA